MQELFSFDAANKTRVNVIISMLLKKGKIPGKLRGKMQRAH
jgi:hypothetical protein